MPIPSPLHRRAGEPFRKRGQPQAWVLVPAVLLFAVLLVAVLLAALLVRPGRDGVLAAEPPAPVHKLIKPEASWTVEGPAQAVAINADESILAVAREQGGQTLVSLYDRPSHSKLGNLAADVGGAPRLRFAADQDLLLIGGSQALELWEVPIMPLRPDQVLPDDHRRWRQPLAGTGGTMGTAQFSDPPDHVVWVQGGALYRRALGDTGAGPSKPVWQPEGRTVKSFQYARNGSGLAVSYQDDKAVDVLDPKALTLLGTLQGHRFPVISVMPGPQGWLSADQGGNVIRWNESLQPQETTYLDALSKGQPPEALQRLGPRHVLLTLAGPAPQRSLTLVAPGLKADDELQAGGEGLVAVSPTGRYLLAAEGTGVSLYDFDQPDSPMDFVKRLKALKAYRTAQSYVRLLDESGVTPRLKTALLAELSRVPASALVQDYLDRLAHAQKEADDAGTKHWAEQVLALRPDEPQARAALQGLKTAAEKRILDEARAALQGGNADGALELLTNKIPPDSAVWGEAAALIRQAESRRRADADVDQAREQMNLGNLPAATALAKEALREQGQHPGAKQLLREIEQKSGGAPREGLAVLLGTVLALAISGFLLYQNRARLVPLFRNARRGAQPPLGRYRAEGSAARTGPFGATDGGTGVGASHAAPGAPQVPPSFRRRQSAVAAAESRAAESRAAEARAAEARAAEAKAAEIKAAPARAAESKLGEAGGEPGTTAAHAIGSKVTESQPGGFKTGGARGAGAQAAEEKIAGSRPDPSRPEGDAQGSAARVEVLRELLESTEDLIRLARQADLAGEHTAALMEIDAELAAFHRRLADPAMELGDVHKRLKVVNARLKGLKFSRPKPPPETTPAEEGSDPTHYELLQIPEQASEGQIKRAYHRLLKQYHPDVHNHSEFPWVKAEAERMSRRLGQAYEVLGHPDKRRDYDQSLRRRRKAHA